MADCHAFVGGEVSPAYQLLLGVSLSGLKDQGPIIIRASPDLPRHSHSSTLSV